MALDIKKIMRGFKLFNNATQSDSVTLNVPDSYTGNYTFEFPNTGTTSGQQVVTTDATQTLTGKTITLAGVTPNRMLRSDGAGTVASSNVTYSDSSTDVTLDITNARDFVINGKAVRVPIAAADPAGVQGDIYFNSVGQELRFYNSGGWQALAASAAANQTLSNLLSPTSVNQDLIPSDNSKDLGSTLAPWDNIHANIIESGTVTSATVEANTVDIVSTVASTNDLTVRAVSLKYDIDQASDPSGVAQQQYYNSTDNTFKYHNGTSWQTFANLTNIPLLAANKNLSNLSTTSVNQSLLFDTHNTYNIGSSTVAPAIVNSGTLTIIGSDIIDHGSISTDLTNPSFPNLTMVTPDTTTTNSTRLFLKTGNSTTGAPGNVFISSGVSNTNSGNLLFSTGAGTGITSGGIFLTTGSSLDTQRGSFSFTAGVDGAPNAGIVSISGRYVKIPVSTFNPLAPGGGTPEAGSMYFDTNDSTLHIHNGTVWRKIATTV